MLFDLVIVIGDLMNKWLFGLLLEGEIRKGFWDLRVGLCEEVKLEKGSVSFCVWFRRNVEVIFFFMSWKKKYNGFLLYLVDFMLEIGF